MRGGLVSAGRFALRPLKMGRLVGPLLAASVLAPIGCGLAAADGPKAKSRSRMAPRDTHLAHEDCPVAGSGAGIEDVNGDGRPDRRAHSEGAKLACTTLDFNFDGVVDAWVYLDEAGKVRRRENDYDHDGNADEVALYRAGVLVEQQRSTVHAGKLDTWHYFSDGKLSRSERDANGDDYIDQWWEYPEARSRDCPLIHSDVDGDGRPDPGATVDVCGGGSATGSETETLAAPGTGVSEAPTEVDAAERAVPGAAAGSGGAGAGAGDPPKQSPGGSP
jgi:hypothetical protein